MYFFSPFFWLDPKEPKGQGYTSKAANSLRSAKIPDNSRFTLRQPGFLYAPLAICFTPSPLGRSFLSLAFRSSLLFFFLSSYFSPFNSQFSTLHSQLTKSRRVFIISRRLFIKRRRLFSLSCLPFKSNKRESISILVGFTFDSRLVWNKLIQKESISHITDH